MRRRRASNPGPGKAAETEGARPCVGAAARDKGRYGRNSLPRLSHRHGFELYHGHAAGRRTPRPLL
nr:MAG TPA: hypothetical protein [Caudoviricetes sp.]